MTMTEQPSTDEQRAEWQAMSARMHELAEAHHEAQRDAGSWLAHGITHPESAEFAQGQAREAAQKSIDLWAEREAVHAQYDAHPYTAKVRAEINEARAERGEKPITWA